MRAKATMSCEFCDGTVERRVILTDFHYMGRTIYVDGVPAWVCRQCGERYFDGTVYERLEAIAKRSGRLKKTIQFPFARYTAPRRAARPARAETEAANVLSNS